MVSSADLEADDDPRNHPVNVTPRGSTMQSRLDELEKTMALCRKMGVTRLKTWNFEMEFAQTGSTPTYLDENLPPERQMQELEKHVAEQRKRIEQTALVDSLGAS